MSVFNSTNQNSVVKASMARINIDGTPVIALDVNMTFQRSVEVVPTISDVNVLSLGRPQGQFTAQTVLCSANDASAAFKLNGDDCAPFQMVVTMDGTCDMQGKTITMSGCVSSAVSLQMQGGRGYVIQGLTVTFTQLDMS